MTEEELLVEIRGAATIALDSNAVFRERIVRMGRLIHQINGLRDEPDHLQLVIPALVHAEHSLHERERHGPDFDLHRSLGSLAEHATVIPYEQRDGDGFAERVRDVFPSREHREAARQRRFAMALGLAEIPTSAGKCPATTDWHIAFQAATRNWLLVTDDKGEEFQRVRRVRYQAMLDALESLPAIQ